MTTNSRDHNSAGGCGLSTFGEAALAYARRGWPVFPLRPRTKLPATPHGFQDASTDEAIIKSWWAAMPAAGVGIATGQVSGLLVLDVDAKNGGAESLRELEARHGALPETAQVITGDGGSHYYFSLPPGAQVSNSAGVLGPGLDVRGDGGYVAAPGTIHPNGRAYVWEVAHDIEDIPLAQAPGWLIELLTAQKQGGAVLPPGQKLPLGKRALTFVANGAPVGQQRQEAVAAARNYLSAGFSMEDTAAAIWRGLQVSPQGEPKRAWAYEDALKIAQDLAGKPAPPPAPAKPGRKSPEPFPALPLANLVDGALPPVPWLVKGVLPEQNALILGGFSSYGKSWLLLTLGLSLASGRPWLDHFQTTQVPVLYIDEENSAYERRRRLRRLLAGYGFDSNLPICFVSDSGLRLSYPPAVARLDATIKLYQPKVVLFDTLIRILGTDENDASRVAQAFAQVKTLMARYGCAMVFADHYRKPSGFDPGPEFALRGSSDKLNFCDSLLTIRRSRQSGQLQVAHTKARFGPSMPTFGFRIEDVGEGTVLPCEVVAEEEEKASLIDEAKESILGLFASGESAFGRKELIASLGDAVSERWGDEALRELIAKKRLVKEGRGRAVRYRLPPPQL